MRNHLCEGGPRWSALLHSAAMRAIWRHANADAGSTDARPDASGVAVIDATGAAFDTIRITGLDIGLFRVLAEQEVPSGDPSVVIYATYDEHELEAAASFLRRHPTVVLGMGLGEHFGSRALALGALGYVHDGLAPSNLRDRFTQATLRHRYRTTRGMPLSAHA